MQPNPEYPDYHPEYPDTPIRTIRILIRSIRTPHPDYPDLCPEYLVTLAMFHTFPPLRLFPAVLLSGCGCGRKARRYERCSCSRLRMRLRKKRVRSQRHAYLRFLSPHRILADCFWYSHQQPHAAGTALVFRQRWWWAILSFCVSASEDCWE